MYFTVCMNALYIIGMLYKKRHRQLSIVEFGYYMHNKKTLRQLMRDKRRAYSNSEQLIASEKLCNMLSKQASVKVANNIALYLANDGELNPHLFIEWCWRENKKVYLPVLHPFSHGNLLFLNYTEDTPLIPNKYGILEPQLNVQNVICLQALDILFTPLVAFDLTGKRLGMGGGFYDRTLHSWHIEKSIKNKSLKYTPIGLAHDFQQVDKLSSELWDIPLPEIITPTQKIVCKTR